MSTHHTRPEQVRIHESGWAPLNAEWEVTALSLLDTSQSLEDGSPLFARLNYDEACGVGMRFGAELFHVELWAALERVALILQPELRKPTAQMSSLEWSRSHDAAVWKQLRARVWSRAQPVLGDGKYWVTGAPAGKSRLMGWDKDGPGAGTALWQPAAVAHNRAHFDYGTTTKLVRRRRSS